MYGKIVRATYQLLAKGMGRGDFWRYYAELEKSQYLSSEEIRVIQLTRLKALLNHAYDNVPYYRRRFDEAGVKPADIKDTADLARLPILTRSEVRENPSDLIAMNFPKEKMIPYSTGGSTGKPLQFYVTRENSAWGSAAAYRAYKWYGYEMGDKIAYLWGAGRDLSAQQRMANQLRNLFFRRIHLDAFNMSETELNYFVSRFIKFKPKAIIAYASAAYLLARYVKQRGVEGITPEVIITQAEKLFAHQRRLIKDVFGCQVFDFYGSREVGGMASECPRHNGYHISAENVVLELVRDNEPVPPGEVGKILVTDLTNYAMPFIRYENGDLGMPSDEACSCGINLPLMKSVEGRITDTLVIGDKCISSPALTLVFKDLPIKQYQIIQETEGKIVVKIVKGADYADAHTEALRKLLKRYVGNIEVDIVFLDSIPLPSSGKHRFIISKVPAKF